MGRPKKHRDLDRRVVNLLDVAPKGMRFNELVAELQPGSRTTLADSLRSLVKADLIEQDYPTKTFRITELGRQVVRRSVLRRREMEFLVQSGIFKDEDIAVAAAIHFWLGLMRSFSSKQLVYLLPVRIDRNGHLLGVPRTEDDWQRLEESSGTIRKVGHDVENESIQTLQAFVKKHSGPAGLVIPRNTSEVSKLWNKAWPEDAVNSLMVAFASDKQIVETETEFLRKFLRANYSDGIDERTLGKLGYDKFRTFKNKFPEQVKVGDAKR